MGIPYICYNALGMVNLYRAVVELELKKKKGGSPMFGLSLRLEIEG